jgi:AAA+ superfamily predicted ATPase
VLDNLRAALALNPDNIPLRVTYAELLLAEHRPAEAQAEFDVGLELAPGDPQLKAGLAQAFFAQGFFSKALVVCEQLTVSGPTGGDTYLLLARCHLQLEDEDAAAHAYRKARDLDPTLHDDDLHRIAPPEAGEEGISLEFTGGDPSGSFEPYIERPSGGFADVGGMQDLKRQISLKIIEPLRKPEVYRAYGKAIGGGILLYGPPGCGKTHLARATAGEVEATFISVGITDVLDMYTGQSERNLRDLFDRARSHKPSVLFFDEVDALAASRRDMRQSAGRQVINQFLAELDGIQANNDGVLVLAATNAPWHLDGAFRRPGRFDRILFVPPPDEPARDAILRVLLRDKPAGEVDTATLAKKTKDFSGADLRAVVDEAIEGKLEKALESGVPEALTTKDLVRAAKRVKPTTREWFGTARNHALYANDSGLYDDILDHLGLKR